MTHTIKKEKITTNKGDVKNLSNIICKGSHLGERMLRYFSIQQSSNDNKKDIQSIVYTFTNNNNVMMALPSKEKADNAHLIMFDISTNSKIFNNISNHYINERNKINEIQKKDNQEEEDIDIFGSDEDDSPKEENEYPSHIHKLSFFNKDKSIKDKFESIKNINLKDLLNN